MSAITIRLAADKLVSLSDLVAATAAAVQPDATKYKIVDRGRPIGHFSRQGEVRQAHERQLLTMIAAGTVIARSLLSRAPWATVEWLDGDADKCGLTFDDARAFCRSLMIDVQPLEVPVTAKPATEPAPTVPWKMRVQAEAAAEWKRQRAMDCNPTRQSIRPHVFKWCRENDIRTPTHINPSDSYLRVHVLSGKHWTPPD